MANMKGPSEGGSGGKRGHSAMEHWAHTEEIKEAARTQRRIDDRQQSVGGTAEDLPDADLPAIELIAGRYRFRAIYRVVDTDHGITINVYGPRDSDTEEVLRFDCFAADPHFHLGWSYLDRPYIPIDDPDPLKWAFRKLSTLNELLASADADLMTAPESSSIRRLLPEFEAKTRRLQANS